MILYADAYLRPQCTPERAERARTDVTALGEFPDDWTDRLIVLRTYCIACLECSNAPDDAFAAKLAHYRKEYTQSIAQARAAAAADSGTTVLFAAIPMERN